MANDDRDDQEFQPTRTSRQKRSFWLPLIGGGAVLCLLGFGLGVLIGVLFEEPNLLVGHMAGDSQEVRLESTTPSEEKPANEKIEAPTEPVTAPVAPRDASREEEIVAKAEAPQTSMAKPSAHPTQNSVALRDVVSGAAKGALLPAVSAAKSDTGTSVATGKFVIQVGAFSNDTQAAEMVKRLQGKGYDSFVASGEGGDARWRVRVGPFQSREVAEQMATKLKQQEKLPTWILAE